MCIGLSKERRGEGKKRRELSLLLLLLPLHPINPPPNIPQNVPRPHFPRPTQPRSLPSPTTGTTRVAADVPTVLACPGPSSFKSLDTSSPPPPPPAPRTPHHDLSRPHSSHHTRHQHGPTAAARDPGQLPQTTVRDIPPPDSIFCTEACVAHISVRPTPHPHPNPPTHLTHPQLPLCAA